MPIQHAKSSDKNLSIGFTLIELMIVVAIIGVISSVVLGQLSSARNKGADATVKANLNNARGYAELIYEDPTLSPVGYNTVCGTPKMVAFKDAAVAANGGLAGSCTSVVASWRMYVPLKAANRAWCVDSTGASREIGTPVAGGSTCPAF